MNSHMYDEFGHATWDPRAVAGAAWHALFWLATANAVGLLIAVLLIVPSLNSFLGEWTYGRWIMVHMNLELYGWTSLPLVGLLFRIYGADRGAFAKWCRPALWVWSAALAVGAFSWLSGQSTGKLFLDWSGYARAFFVDALLALWFFLVLVFFGSRHSKKNLRTGAWAAKIAGLAILLAVPIVLYRVTGPSAYPAVNPDSGGPTGASQLESSLSVVLILLILPFGLAPRRAERKPTIATGWIVLFAELLLCFALGRADVSNHRPVQFLSLASLLLWLPLIPAYYASFEWHSNTRLWRVAFQWWWAALVITGWVFFLPGVLDHFKFTDGLVGHSFVAMAGFTSSLIIFVMVQLLGDDGWIFNRPRSFYLWHGSVIAYIVLMTVAGWREGFDPTFTIIPGMFRNVLYSMRLCTGLLMLLASLDWLIDCTSLLRRPAPVAVTAVLQEVH